MMQMNEDFIPLLRKGVEWVEEQDKLDPKIREWMQSEWTITSEFRVSEHGHPVECGTGRCLAGYLGYQIDPAAFKDDWVHPETGEYVDTYVQRVMEIDDSGYEEGDIYHDLWAGDNTAEDIRRIAEEIAGQKL